LYNKYTTNRSGVWALVGSQNPKKCPSFSIDPREYKQQAMTIPLTVDPLFFFTLPCVGYPLYGCKSHATINNENSKSGEKYLKILTKNMSDNKIDINVKLKYVKMKET